MREDVAIIAAKIAGAVGGDLYSIRMQNASIVREHAIHLYMQVGNLRFLKNYKDIKYVDMLRNEIEKFQMLSTASVGSFDGTNHLWDERKLVNPPVAIQPDAAEHNSEDDFFEPNFFLKTTTTSGFGLASFEMSKNYCMD
jgi:hypothetical protein